MRDFVQGIVGGMVLGLLTGFFLGVMTAAWLYSRGLGKREVPHV